MVLQQGLSVRPLVESRLEKIGQRGKAASLDLKKMGESLLPVIPVTPAGLELQVELEGRITRLQDQEVRPARAQVRADRNPGKGLETHRVRRRLPRSRAVAVIPGH